MKTNLTAMQAELLPYLDGTKTMEQISKATGKTAVAITFHLTGIKKANVPFAYLDKRGKIVGHKTANFMKNKSAVPAKLPPKVLKNINPPKQSESPKSLNSYTIGDQMLSIMGPASLLVMRDEAGFNVKII